MRSGDTPTGTPDPGLRRRRTLTSDRPKLERQTDHQARRKPGLLLFASGQRGERRPCNNGSAIPMKDTESPGNHRCRCRPPSPPAARPRPPPGQRPSQPAVWPVNPSPKPAAAAAPDVSRFPPLVHRLVEGRSRQPGVGRWQSPSMPARYSGGQWPGFTGSTAEAN